MDFNPEQVQAAKKLESFTRGPRKIFRLMGYAGTGKTSLLSHVLGGRPDVFYSAPTAKAAQVLTSKGLSAQTLHSLMYTPYETKDRATGRYQLGFKLNPKSILNGGGFIVVDEASMVPQWMADDLLNEFPVRVIAVGDNYQLPPVMSSGNQSLLSGAPDVELTEVMRTTLENSPVTALATAVRKNGKLQGLGSRGGSGVYRRLSETGRSLDSYSQIIVGTHRTRFDLINRMRGSVNTLPRKDDRVICKSNSKEFGMVNGEQYFVHQTYRLDPETVELVLRPRDEDSSSGNVVCTAWTHGFTGPEGREKLAEMPMKERNTNVEIWPAYAITAHSAQGSEWDDVLVVDESRTFRQYPGRWLYTAITRARESVTVVGRI